MKTISVDGPTELSSRMLPAAEDLVVEFSDGSSYCIEACDHRVYLFLSRNGVLITVMLHEDPVDGFHPADRIQLTLADSKGLRGAYFMTALEAMAIAEGLNRACVMAIANDMPTS